MDAILWIESLMFEIRELRAMFKEADKNGDNRFSVDEIVLLMNKMNIEIDKAGAVTFLSDRISSKLDKSKSVCIHT